MSDGGAGPRVSDSRGEQRPDSPDRGGRRPLGDPRLTIARRDVASLSREKTIVLALLIQLFVAAFSSFLVVGLTSLYSPGSVSAGEIVVGVSGEHGDAVVEAARGRRDVRAVTYGDEAALREDYRDGRLHAGMVASDAGGRISVTVIAPRESIRTTLVVDKVRTLLEAVERAERAERSAHLTRDVVAIPREIEASPYFGFTYTVLVPLLLFLPPFISGSVAVDSLTEEVERGTLELLRVAPVTLVHVVEGKALGMILLAPLQAALWIGLLVFNGIGVGNVPALLVLVTAFATVVVVLGLSLGLVTGRRRQAQLLYSVLVLFAFGTLVFLPEHPATTVAKLAVDSATTATYLHVVGYAVAAVAAIVLARRLAASADPESL